MVARSARGRGARYRAALLRRDRALHAAARLVERQRLRSAGAALSRHGPRHRGNPLLGHGRGRPRVQVQQLHLALPLAPPRPDGRPRRLPESRLGAPGRDRAALRPARQAGHGRLAGLPGVEARRDRCDPRLLRDRRRQHLPSLPALPADPRRPRSGRVCEGDRALPRLPRGAGCAALEGIRGGLESGVRYDFRRSDSVTRKSYLTPLIS